MAMLGSVQLPDWKVWVFGVVPEVTGAPKAAFEDIGHPRPTALFGPTFNGGPPIRCADVTQDPRYGRWAPHHGMPPGHLPLRSYLAVPVVAQQEHVRLFEVQAVDESLTSVFSYLVER